VTGVRPQGRAEIRELLAKHGLRPNKALGQNFLADPNVVERIVREAAVGPDSKVVEVGAGTGTLTRALAATGAALLAYEIDAGLASVVAEAVLGFERVEVIHADATRDDIGSRLGEERWVMVANLPYNVGTPLLLDLLQATPQIERFVVMVQAEVADRLVAQPGSRSYGIPSVIAALHADVRSAFRVPPTVFIPKPEVDSAVVVLDRREPPAGAARAIAIASAAFGQRRKMLRRSLAGLLGDAEAVLTSVGIDPTARAETLQASDFVRIALAAG
jgi:16S rRNA (adenine1518-N6/adenine1519-N6)-dimethyltransferase